ncbi:MAG: hypothetical protein GF383_12025 [Candidatus Lokiarchaeota archaeon]|nr:hypothetical protein [Candidatus Lokiarchaeota archaeon]MBD3341613.1 hypothetical protein [Candidatus Lokiarchaeota archaeon]
MATKLIKKWHERKVIAPLHLALVYITMAIAVFTLILGLLEAFITGYYKELYRFSLPFAYSCVVVWNLFFFMFIREITERGNRVFIPLVVIGIIIIIALWLPTNWWGFPAEAYEGKLNTRLYSTGSLVAHSAAIYIAIIIICQKAKKRTEDKKTQLGLSLLAYSMISALMWFFFIIMDTVLIVFSDHPGYSIFIYIAWIFTFIFMILSYLSLIMPNWLVKYIEKEN